MSLMGIGLLRALSVCRDDAWVMRRDESRRGKL